jgi:[ribosomal protein S5]-alanine N-acetyltransferase
MPPLVRTVVPPVAARPQPVIRTLDSSIVLRPWRHADADQLKAAFADAEVQRWNLHRLSTAAEAADWVERWNGRWRKRVGASWAVVGKWQPNIVLGQVAFRSLYLADGLAELSCWIAPAARRRHIATDATRMLSRWAFDELRLERLEIVHSTQNPASCPVALAAGFRIEGVKRRLQRHTDGFHDMCLHSRISSDDGEPIPPPEPVPTPAPPAVSVRKPLFSRKRQLVGSDR